MPDKHMPDHGIVKSPLPAPLTRREQTLRHQPVDRPLVMGILNVTPDSFSDGGCFDQFDSAVNHAADLLSAGADIIDIGGESTRPGALPVSLAAELDRVIPLITALRRQFPDCVISIDTHKPEVMTAAIKAGADMINDVNALRSPGAIAVAAQLDVPIYLMHMQGEPRTMQENPVYQDLIGDIIGFFEQRIQACLDGGIKRHNICIDPGFGFGKTPQQNYVLLQQLDKLQSLQCPILVGMSRKSMIGYVLDNPVAARLSGSLACAVLAAERGAKVIRVHDVQQTVEVLKIVAMMNNPLAK